MLRKSKWILNYILDPNSNTKSKVARVVCRRQNSPFGKCVKLISDGELSIHAAFTDLAVSTALADHGLDSETTWNSALLILHCFSAQLKTLPGQDYGEYVLLVEKFNIWDLQPGYQAKYDVKFCMENEQIWDKMVETFRERTQKEGEHVNTMTTESQPLTQLLEEMAQISTQASTQQSQPEVEPTEPRQTQVDRTISLADRLVEPFTAEEFLIPSAQAEILDRIEMWKDDYCPPSSDQGSRAEVNSLQATSEEEFNVCRTDTLQNEFHDRLGRKREKSRQILVASKYLKPREDINYLGLTVTTPPSEEEDTEVGHSRKNKRSEAEAGGLVQTQSSQHQTDTQSQASCSQWQEELDSVRFSFEDEDQPSQNSVHDMDTEPSKAQNSTEKGVVQSELCAKQAKSARSFLEVVSAFSAAVKNASKSLTLSKGHCTDANNCQELPKDQSTYWGSSVDYQLMDSDCEHIVNKEDSNVVPNITQKSAENQVSCEQFPDRSQAVASEDSQDRHLADFSESHGDLGMPQAQSTQKSDISSGVVGPSWELVKKTGSDKFHVNSSVHRTGVAEKDKDAMVVDQRPVANISCRDISCSSLDRSLENNSPVTTVDKVIENSEGLDTTDIKVEVIDPEFEKLLDRSRKSQSLEKSVMNEYYSDSKASLQMSPLVGDMTLNRLTETRIKLSVLSQELNSEVRAESLECADKIVEDLKQPARLGYVVAKPQKESTDKVVEDHVQAAGVIRTITEPSNKRKVRTNILKADEIDNEAVDRDKADFEKLKIQVAKMKASKTLEDDTNQIISEQNSSLCEKEIIVKCNEPQGTEHNAELVDLNAEQKMVESSDSAYPSSTIEDEAVYADNSTSDLNQTNLEDIDQIHREVIVNTERTGNKWERSDQKCHSKCKEHLYKCKNVNCMKTKLSLKKRRTISAASCFDTELGSVRRSRRLCAKVINARKKDSENEILKDCTTVEAKDREKRSVELILSDTQGTVAVCQRHTDLKKLREVKNCQQSEVVKNFEESDEGVSGNENLGSNQGKILNSHSLLHESDASFERRMTRSMSKDKKVLTRYRFRKRKTDDGQSAVPDVCSKSKENRALKCKSTATIDERHEKNSSERRISETTYSLRNDLQADRQVKKPCLPKETKHMYLESSGKNASTGDNKNQRANKTKLSAWEKHFQHFVEKNDGEEKGKTIKDDKKLAETQSAISSTQPFTAAETQIAETALVEEKDINIVLVDFCTQPFKVNEFTETQEFLPTVEDIQEKCQSLVNAENDSEQLLATQAFEPCVDDQPQNGTLSCNKENCINDTEKLLRSKSFNCSSDCHDLALSDNKDDANKERSDTSENRKVDDVLNNEIKKPTSHEAYQNRAERSEMVVEDVHQEINSYSIEHLDEDSQMSELLLKSKTAANSAHVLKKQCSDKRGKCWSTNFAEERLGSRTDKICEHSKQKQSVRDTLHVEKKTDQGQESRTTLAQWNVNVNKDITCQKRNKIFTKVEDKQREREITQKYRREAGCEETIDKIERCTEKAATDLLEKLNCAPGSSTSRKVKEPIVMQTLDKQRLSSGSKTDTQKLSVKEAAEQQQHLSFEKFQDKSRRLGVASRCSISSENSLILPTPEKKVFRIRSLTRRRSDLSGKRKRERTTSDAGSKKQKIDLERVTDEICRDKDTSLTAISVNETSANMSVNITDSGMATSSIYSEEKTPTGKHTHVSRKSDMAVDSLMPSSNKKANGVERREREKRLVSQVSIHAAKTVLRTYEPKKIHIDGHCFGNQMSWMNYIKSPYTGSSETKLKSREDKTNRKKSTLSSSQDKKSPGEEKRKSASGPEDRQNDKGDTRKKVNSNDIRKSSESLFSQENDSDRNTKQGQLNKEHRQQKQLDERQKHGSNSGADISRKELTVNSTRETGHVTNLSLTRNKCDQKNTIEGSVEETGKPRKLTRIRTSVREGDDTVQAGLQHMSREKFGLVQDWLNKHKDVEHDNSPASDQARRQLDTSVVVAKHLTEELRMSDTGLGAEAARNHVLESDSDFSCSTCSGSREEIDGNTSELAADIYFKKFKNAWKRTREKKMMQFKSGLRDKALDYLGAVF